MLNDAKDLQAVYIVCGYTDLRKGIDSLSNIISQTYGMDPFQPGTLFMFCGRKTDRIKALIWEGDGFLLCYKVNGKSVLPFTYLKNKKNKNRG